MADIIPNAQNTAAAVALAQHAAVGKSIHHHRQKLKVRSDWVLEQIKQRQNDRTVDDMVVQNRARWMEINPDWTEHGPELVLTSRGSAHAALGSAAENTFTGMVFLGVVGFGLYKLVKAVAG